MKSKKTWTREVATLLLGFLCYLAYTNSIEVLEILTWPFMIFAMAAFGFKQPVVEGYIDRGSKR